MPTCITVPKGSVGRASPRESEGCVDRGGACVAQFSRTVRGKPSAMARVRASSSAIRNGSALGTRWEGWFATMVVKRAQGGTLCKNQTWSFFAKAANGCDMDTLLRGTASRPEKYCALPINRMGIQPPLCSQPAQGIATLSATVEPTTGARIRDLLLQRRTLYPLPVPVCHVDSDALTTWPRGRLHLCSST